MSQVIAYSSHSFEASLSKTSGRFNDIPSASNTPDMNCWARPGCDFSALVNAVRNVWAEDK